MWWVVFGCVSSMPRFCNSSAGSVFSGVAIAEAQRRPAPTDQHASWLGLEPGALRLDVGCCVLLQLGFEGLRLGDKADDAAAITAILDAEIGHEIANATRPRQLRRIVRHLRWRVAGRVRRPPDGVGVTARPRGRA